MNWAVDPVLLVRLCGWVTITGKVGDTRTLSMACVLLAVPALLLTVTEYLPALAACALLIVNEVLVAPAKRFVPLKNHWKLGGGTPLAEALKAALLPCVTVRLTGCRMIIGGTRTLSAATALVTEPEKFT